MASNPEEKYRNQLVVFSFIQKPEWLSDYQALAPSPAEKINRNPNFMPGIFSFSRRFDYFRDNKQKVFVLGLESLTK
jgi:hypothetical protein